MKGVKVIDGVHIIWPIYRIGCFSWYIANLLKFSHLRFDLGHLGPSVVMCDHTVDLGHVGPPVVVCDLTGYEGHVRPYSWSRSCGTASGRMWPYWLWGSCATMQFMRSCRTVSGHLWPYSLRGHVGPLVVIVTIHPLRSFEVIAWNYRVCTSMFSGLRWNSATWMVSLVDGIRIEFSIQEKWAQSFPHFDRLENDNHW